MTMETPISSTELGDGIGSTMPQANTPRISRPGIIQQVHDVPEIPGAHLIAMLRSQFVMVQLETCGNLLNWNAHVSPV